MDIKSLITEIKSRAIIEDIIGRYVNLKKSGKNYVALCPFHHEKTPSFTVSPDKGFFHCFGCGKSGDVITFVSEIEKIPFMDAVRKVASEVGIDLDTYLSKHDVKNKSLITKLKHLNIEVQKFFSYYLLKGDGSKTGINYLRKRGINSEVARKFKFGMAPNSKNTLYRYLKSRFFTDETIFESRLVVNTSSGPIDLFRYRITFPIENQYGEIVGFAGRTLSNEEKTKYINLPETVLFKKRNVLFAFNHAKERIKQTGRVFLVEGYFDVISLHKHGITNVCGVMGTSLTLEQIRLFSSIANEVYLFFDSDTAGVNAVERVIPLILNNTDLRVKIVRIPEKDPDEFVKSLENKKENIDEGILLKNSYNPIDFFIEVNQDIIRGSNTNEKMRFLVKMFFFVSLIKNLYEKEESLKKLAEILGLSDSMVRLEFEKYVDRQKISELSIVGTYSKLSIEELELVLVYMIMKDNKLIDILKSEFAFEDFKNDLVRVYLSFLDSFIYGEEVKEEDINNLYLIQSEIESKVSPVVRVLGENLKEEFDYLLAIYKIRRIRERKKEIQSIINRISKDTPDYEDLMSDLLEEKHSLAIEEEKIKKLRNISFR